MVGIGDSQAMRAKKSVNPPTKQAEGTAPVIIIENTKLPKMTDKVAAHPKRTHGKASYMPTEPTPDKGGSNRMDPVPTNITIVKDINHEYSPQEEESKSS
jgi:hypothetical protein